MAKIALLGSAPSSLGLAPFSDPAWQIWACSPGTYHQLPRCDAFFELHRWEPGVIGKAATQKPWLSPEYVAWMGKQRLVWMAEPVPEIPNSHALPFEAMNQRWGSYFWNSSLSYMIAMALDCIIALRKKRAFDGLSQEAQDLLAVEDQIGLWGVDMAATEEWIGQRSGCQHFICEANRLGVGVVVPPESDLLRPDPPYGLFESTHFMIKATSRLNELQSRLASINANLANLNNESHFIRGAIDNHNYHIKTWGADREGLAAHPEVARMQCDPIASESPPGAVAGSAALSSVAGEQASTGATVLTLKAGA